MLNFQNCYEEIQGNSELNFCEVLKINLCDRVLIFNNIFKVKYLNDVK